jgi:hypothetical protein
MYLRLFLTDNSPVNSRNFAFSKQGKNLFPCKGYQRDTGTGEKLLFTPYLRNNKQLWLHCCLDEHFHLFFIQHKDDFGLREFNSKLKM